MKFDKYSKLKLFKKTLLVSLVVLLLLLLIPTSPVVQAADDDNDTIDDAEEWSLIMNYAPNLYFKAGENFFPIDCTYFLNNSELWHWSGSSRSLVDANPNLNTIDDGYDNYHFLDYSGNYTDILGNYTLNRTTWGYKIYGHVVPQGGYWCVQYWFFYIYNDHAFNQHEGDWEMITILLNASTKLPIGACYSQHYIGQYAAWADVDKTGNHSYVYVAKGSHANYFRPCQGKLGLESDEVGNDGFQLPWDHPSLTIEQLGERGVGNHTASQNWLDFEGRWGDWRQEFDAFIGFAGPLTPGEGDNAEKWYSPASWVQNQMTVNSMWFFFSCFMYYLLWIFLAIFGLMALIKIIRAIKNRTSKEVPKLSVVLGGRAAVGTLFAIVAMGITVAVIFLPWYEVYLNITSPVISAEGQIILIDGMHGVQANMILTGGMTPLFNVAIPFYVILGAGIVLTLLDFIGASSAKKLGTKQLTGGIGFLILLIVIIIIISQLGGLSSLLAPIFGGALPAEVTTILNSIAAAPFGGQISGLTISGIVTADLTWGLALGGILLIASAVVKILAGIILRSTPESA